MAQIFCKCLDNQLVFPNCSLDVISRVQECILMVCQYKQLTVCPCIVVPFGIYLHHIWLLWHEKRRQQCDYHKCIPPHLISWQRHQGFGGDDHKKCLYSRKKEIAFLCSWYHVKQKLKVWGIGQDAFVSTGHSVKGKHSNELWKIWVKSLD